MPLGPSNVGNSVLGWREHLPDLMQTPAVDIYTNDDGDDPHGDHQHYDSGSQQPQQQVITNPDGSVSIYDVPQDGMAMYRGHFENLAEDMDAGYLATLAADLIEEVESDEMSRAEWTAMRVKAVDLLGLKLEEPGGESSNGTIAKVHNGSMLDACVRYQANFIGEMLPVGGPCKVDDTSQGGPPARNELADAFEKDMNYYLTNVAEEYYPQMDRGAFRQGLDGGIFTKQFHCPLRRRPASDVIYATDLIVSNDATSIRGAGRVTHRIWMRQGVMKRMQILKVYRDVPLQAPTEEPDEMQSKIKSTEGQSPAPLTNKQEDERHELYEIYVDRSLRGHEHKEGLELPYRITVEKESSVILEIRRNWEEDDENYTPLTKLVMYPLIPGLGFYPYGFAHLIGNSTRALTAIMRQLIDAGMFASFPGWLRAKMGSRQLTNQLRIQPGGSQEIETGGLPLSDVIMPVPYKDPSATLAAFYTTLETNAKNLAGAVEIPVGDGKADIPVGTMLALIEQSTKVMGAIHKRNHRAQGEELRNIKALFCEDPQALSVFNKKPNRQWQAKEEFEDIDLVPASDPNIPSHIHRLMQTQAVVMRADADVNGLLYDKPEVEKWALRNIGISNPDQLLKKPPPPGAPPPMPAAPDPAKLIALQSTAREAEQTREIQQEQVSANNKMTLKKMDLEDRAAERENRMAVAQIDLHKEIVSAHSNAHATNADLLTGAHANHTDLAATALESHSNMEVAKEGTEAAREATKAAKHKATGAKPVGKSGTKRKQKTTE